MFVDERMTERTLSITLMFQSYSDETGRCAVHLIEVLPILYGTGSLITLFTWVHH
jgi:hypothetical protein